ncbi:MAG: hypothetical protein JNM84_17745 [Planctomycetes bacterium]|nr:hypothetical protein [Planctomycetota bacterium]
MRVQKAKLLIVLAALGAGVAVAGRLGWFAAIGKKTILNPAAGRLPADAVTDWYNGRRTELWNKDPVKAPTARTKIELYSTIATANVSGSEPPKKEEVREVTPTSSGPEPYPHFPEVSITGLILGDGDHRQDDRVVLLFEVKQPRAHLEDKAKVPLGYYREGETLDPFPEIKVERIDPLKNLVSFRMPKHRDARGRYEGYKADASDSQVIERVVLTETLDSKLLSSKDAASLDAVEKEDSARRQAASMRLLALDREAPKFTEETFPGSNNWAIGTEDLSSLAEDYDDRIRQDVTATSYNKNGVVGVQIQRISEKSVFFGKGLMQNDVVIAVNEHSIPTMSEAVRYVRKNPERNFYEFKVLRNGRERILTYHVPR